MAHTDGGTTWQQRSDGNRSRVNLPQLARGGDYPQNWYDQGVAVDPNNPEHALHGHLRHLEIDRRRHDLHAM